MIRFVYGGAHQGKWSYAKASLVEEKMEYLDGHDCPLEICHAEGNVPIVFNCVHHWVRRMLEAGRSPREEMEEWIGRMEHRRLILLCDDIGGGLVPLDPDRRIYREMVGRTAQIIAAKADQVIYVQAGIGSRIK